jgi:ribosomal protein S18 acetylase RimI-like enzyme
MISQLTTPKGLISFRIASTEDAAMLLALRLEALLLYPEAFAADVAMTIADGAEAWVNRITDYAKTQSGAIHIALAGDELVGMAGIVRGHWPKTRHSGTLWGVYVKPAWRGLQIGAGIVNGCVAWAIENELTVVNLGVVNTNISAIRCYTHCGFTQIGIQPRSTYYQGSYHDELLMVRLL